MPGGAVGFLGPWSSPSLPRPGPRRAPEPSSLVSSVAPAQSRLRLAALHSVLGQAGSSQLRLATHRFYVMLGAHPSPPWPGASFPTSHATKLHVSVLAPGWTGKRVRSIPFLT